MEHIAPQPEVIRAIFLEGSPCCGGVPAPACAAAAASPAAARSSAESSFRPSSATSPSAAPSLPDSEAWAPAAARVVSLQLRQEFSTGDSAAVRGGEAHLALAPAAPCSSPETPVGHARAAHTPRGRASSRAATWWKDRERQWEGSRRGGGKTDKRPTEKRVTAPFSSWSTDRSRPVSFSSSAACLWFAAASSEAFARHSPACQHAAAAEARHRACSCKARLCCSCKPGRHLRLGGHHAVLEFGHLAHHHHVLAYSCGRDSP